MQEDKKTKGKRGYLDWIEAPDYIYRLTCKCNKWMNSYKKCRYCGKKAKRIKLNDADKCIYTNLRIEFERAFCGK